MFKEKMLNKVPALKLITSAHHSVEVRVYINWIKAKQLVKGYIDSPNYRITNL